MYFLVIYKYTLTALSMKSFASKKSWDLKSEQSLCHGIFRNSNFIQNPSSAQKQEKKKKWKFAHDMWLSNSRQKCGSILCSSSNNSLLHLCNLMVKCSSFHWPTWHSQNVIWCCTFEYMNKVDLTSTSILEI